MPSIWYQAGLHCRTRPPDCDYDVAGWTMAGMPGVSSGTTQSIAWGLTNLGPDTSDLVLEKVEGDSYVVDGVAKPDRAQGGDRGRRRRPGHHHGPGHRARATDLRVGGDVAEDLVNVGQDAPVPAPGQDPDGTAPARGDGYAVALQWTALTPRATFDAFDEMNTATDWTQFRAAAALLKVASRT